jgi:hypothetical protein
MTNAVNKVRIKAMISDRFVTRFHLQQKVCMLWSSGFSDSDRVAYQCFGGPCCLHLHPKDHDSDEMFNTLKTSNLTLRMM